MVTYKSRGRSIKVEYILCGECNLKELSECKVVVGESVARQHRVLMFRMTLMVRKMKRTKAEHRTKWLKLKKEKSCVAFRDHRLWVVRRCFQMTAATAIRETGRKYLVCPLERKLIRRVGGGMRKY
ncbi:hypothetical protein CRENBAI_021037 [Crenichthys baileyi]|uniref:Uncharacterized protein n=1 Tax=Crenichthys baileyi TaxID=28760 RepID=A0AAV9SNY2_9TELE